MVDSIQRISGKSSHIYALTCWSNYRIELVRNASRNDNYVKPDEIYLRETSVTSTFNTTFMDHEFAFLIKRWSDDYESSQKLRQEFASLKQQVLNGIACSAFDIDTLFVQYDCLLGQFQTLQRATSNSNQNRCCQNGVNARRPDCESMKQMVNVNLHPNSHGHLTSVYV